MPRLKTPTAAKITIETTDCTVTAQAHTMSFRHDDWNTLELIEIHRPFDFVSTPNPKDYTVPPEAWNTDEPAVDPVKAAALKHVKLMARKIERTKLANARRVEEAHETGQANLNFAAHDFNEAVLSATHEGIEYEDIQAHLTAEGIHGLSHDVACASGRDWDLLYPSVVE